MNHNIINMDKKGNIVLDKSDLDTLVNDTFRHKLKNYISRKIDSHLISIHNKNKESKKNIKEESPTNVMGSSSSVGSGPISTFDPILFKKKLIKRKKPVKEND